MPDLVPGNVVASGDADFRSVLASVDKRGRRRLRDVAVVDGRWRRLRALAAAGLIAVLLLVPRLQLHGEPLLRIDIPGRHLVLAGATFWPDDLFLLLLLVLTGLVGTLFAVATLGRVACGWVCPHGVLLENVFRRIEHLLLGPAHRRARLRAQGGPLWALRRLAAWTLYALVCVILAESLVAAFAGPEAFRWLIVPDAAAHPAAAACTAIATALMLFDFGWFREQTCTIVCPYGRLQAAMLDRHSLTPSYDTRRGEPRGKPRSGNGDCLDCRQCVAVCPTGIDIRNGNQLECIGCTACIDACDVIMIRAGRKPGLIRYASETELTGGERRLVRPRTLLYAVVLCGLLTGLAATIACRDDLQVSRLRGMGAPLVDHEAGGHASTPVAFALRNRGRQERRLHLELAGNGAGELFTQFPDLALAPGERREGSVIVRVPLDRFRLGSWNGAVRLVDERGIVHELPVHMEMR